MRPYRAALGIIAVLLAAHLLLSLRYGLTRMDTDFPNYYTAAKLTLKREPLRRYYDWVWFQRQIDFAGIDRQLGGYIPHTPFTMLPLLPLTGFSPMRAKQIWILLQVLFLAITILLLARMGRLSVIEVLVL